MLVTIGARVLDRGLPVGRADEAFDQWGRLLDDGQRRSLDELVGGLLATAGHRAAA